MLHASFGECKRVAIRPVSEACQLGTYPSRWGSKLANRVRCRVHGLLSPRVEQCTKTRPTAQKLRLVDPLPCEFRLVTPEVVVGGRLAIDGAQKTQYPDDALGAQIEVVADQGLDCEPESAGGFAEVQNSPA
jgi:hypothetical protein